FETRFFDWTVGLELRVPIGNRARTAAHERSRLEQAQALTAREDTRQQILLEVSDAVRNLAAAEESIQAARAAREAAEQTLADQQANVGAGAALQKDLLEAQRDLADAKVHEIQARAAYMTGRAALEHAKGTLLEYNDMEIIGEGEEDARP
ncbi:MAG: TolC family protein, partial [Phycisphaerae bacterium]